MCNIGLWGPNGTGDMWVWIKRAENHSVQLEQMGLNTSSCCWWCCIHPNMVLARTIITIKCDCFPLFFLSHWVLQKNLAVTKLHISRGRVCSNYLWLITKSLALKSSCIFFLIRRIFCYTSQSSLLASKRFNKKKKITHTHTHTQEVVIYFKNRQHLR